jgi:diguanylate cyclase (GGDEF)-like protein
MPAVAGVLAVVAASCAAASGLLVGFPDRAAFVAAAGTAAFALLGLCAWVIRRPLQPAWAHPVVAGLWLAAAAGTSVAVYLSKDAAYSSGTLLVVAAAGAVMLRLPWLAGTLGGTIAVWIAAMFGAHAWSGSAQWVLAMLWAVVLALVVAEARRRGLDRFAATNERADRIAVQDDVTALLNRRGLSLVGHQMLASARRSGNALHCTIVGFDGRGDLLNRAGTTATDRVVIAVGDALRLSVRSGDVVARWGPDTFCVLGPGPGTAPVELEQRVHGRVAQYPPDDVPGWALRLAAGSAMLAPWDDGDLASLLDQASREQRRRQDLVQRH